MKIARSLLDTNDVAHILDCSPYDVILLARKGILPATKPSRRWRFKEKDVLTYKRWLERATRPKKKGG